MSPQPSTPPDAPDDEPNDELEIGTDDRPARPSNRQRQRESAALSGLAKTLVEMQPSQFAGLELPAEVREAVLVCRGLGRAARTRQIRRVAAMLRVHQVDAVPPVAQPKALEDKRRTERERLYEHWRERLFTEGDATLAEFADRHPMVDPKSLRQLLRAARRKPGSGKSKQALLTVLRVVREAFEVEASVRDQDPDGSGES